MKKLFLTAIIILMLFTTAAADIDADLAGSCITDATAGAAFSDMADIKWAAPSVDFLTSLGVVNGFDDGTFRPDNNITRAEYIKLAVSAFGLLDPLAQADFTDNRKTDWYYPYISTAVKLGIASGKSDSDFDTESYITREEMFDISRKAIECTDISLTSTQAVSVFTDNDEIDERYADSVEYMTSCGIIAGNPDGTVRPKATSTRAEACVMLTRMINFAISSEKSTFTDLENAKQQSDGEESI